MLEGDADLSRVDPALVEGVVGSLVAGTGVDPATLLLVGAQCRNTWSAALGRSEPTRSTYDLDLGIAVRGMESYNRLTAGLTAMGDTGIQYRVGDLPVDLMPFGEGVEHPPGEVAPPARADEPFSVFGFIETHATSVPWSLEPGVIRLASPAGYTLLKIAAWHDRSRWGETKDGVDLAEVIAWYGGSATVQTHLWQDESAALAAAAGYDEALAAAHVAGRCARDVLGPGLQPALDDLWVASRTNLPGVALHSRHLGGDTVRVGALIEWFGHGVTGILPDPDEHRQ